MTAEKTKYGIPVSGRVDVLLHKKLKEEADRYGLTMSKMVDTALSQWAQTEEIRQAEEQLRNKVKQLENQVKSIEKERKKWEETANSLNINLSKQLKDNQQKLATTKQATIRLKSEKTKLVSQLDKMEKHYTYQLNHWQKSVVLFIDTISESNKHKKQLTKSFKQTFKDV